MHITDYDFEVNIENLIQLGIETSKSSGNIIFQREGKVKGP